MTAPDTLPPELAELGELLREDPPRPDPAWARRARRPRGGRLPPAAATVAVGGPEDPPARADRAPSASPAWRCSSCGLSTDRPPERRRRARAAGAGGAAPEPASRGGGAAPRRRPSASIGRRRRCRASRPPPAGGEPRLRRPPDPHQERSAALTLAARPREIERVAAGILRVTDTVGGFVASSSRRERQRARAARSSCASRTRRLNKALAELSRLANVRERTPGHDATSPPRRCPRAAACARRGASARACCARSPTPRRSTRRRPSRRGCGRSTPASPRPARSVRRIANRAAFANVVRRARRRPRRRAPRRSTTARWTPGDALRDAVRVLEVAAGIARDRARAAAPAGAARRPRRARRPHARPPAPRAGARHGLIWDAARHMAASAEETAALLGRVPVFEALRPEDLARVAEVAVPRRFRGGEVVFREGDDSDTCYVVRSGHARAMREHADGRQITLAHVRARRHLRRAGDVRRRAPLGDGRGGRRARRARRSPASTCARCCSRHPEIAVKLVIALGRRLRAANERLARQSFQTVQSRVAAVLAQLVEQARGEGAGERDVLLTATQAELAAARGLLARVGQPLPGRARAGGRDLPGPRPADGPRPGGARRLCLLDRRAATGSRSSYGGVVVRGRDVLVITPAGRHRASRRCPRAAPRDGETGEQTAGARGARGDRASRSTSASGSARSTTSTAAAAGGSARPSTSTSATSCRAPPPTTTTRSTTPAGSRSSRR